MNSCAQYHTHRKHRLIEAKQPTLSKSKLGGAPAFLVLLAALAMSLTFSGCIGLTTASTPPSSASTSSKSATLAASATSINFGKVVAGTSSSQTLTLTNTGTATAMISKATVTGTGVTIVGGMSSVSIAPGQNHAFQIQFAPQTAGTIADNISIVSDATNSPMSISLSGTGVTRPSIVTQPASQTVTVGHTATFAVAAIGMGTLTYQWKKGGTAINGATSSTYTTPATAISGNGAQFTVTVTNSAGSVTSNAATLTVSTSTLLLNASTTSLSFGNVTIGSSKVLSVTLTNAGSASVTISNVSVSGAGYNPSGVSTGLILAAGKTLTLSVTFTPASTTAAPGSVTVTSNATNSPTTITLSGTGVQSVSHSVALSWIPSTSAVSGYNVYRGAVSGGPYSKINSASVATSSYTDSTVQASKTYFYVVTSLDSANVESAFSNQVSATIP